MSDKKVKVTVKVQREASRWTQVLENMPTKNETRRPVEDSVLGKEKRN
jgi:hypothetical protein